MRSGPDEANTPDQPGEGDDIFAQIPAFDVIDGELVPRAAYRLQRPHGDH